MADFEDLSSHSSDEEFFEMLGLKSMVLQSKAKGLRANNNIVGKEDIENEEIMDINKMPFAEVIGDHVIDLPMPAISEESDVYDLPEEGTCKITASSNNDDNELLPMPDLYCCDTAMQDITNKAPTSGTSPDHSSFIENHQLITPQEANNRAIVILSDVPYHGDLTSNRNRNNKATKDPTKWQRNLNRDRRMKGDQYLGYRRDRKVKHKNEKFKVKQDVFRPARSIKPACDSPFCKKSKLRNCDNIDEESRRQLFESFWKTINWEQRKQYISSHVVKVEKKITKNPDSKRTESRAYFFTITNQRHQVCKKMFLNTLGIKEWFVRYWLEKSDCAMPPNSTVSRNISHLPKKKDAHEYLEQFFGILPKMPSHYCRINTTRKYLEPIFQSMSQLYKVYKERCELGSTDILSRRVFDNIFMKHNLSLFHPKKDQCDVCCGHETGNITDEGSYVLHKERKDRARIEKNTDKALAVEGECYVFTQDVQAVKLAPFLQASAIYYKTKLYVHNFTIYNLSTHEAVCNWFDESNSSLEASVFASCLVNHLQSVLDKKILPIILYSDGCCAQNRNCILSNALLRLSIEKKVLITQKYLEKGHTQMECDSVHSAIECKVKGKEIYLPNQYASIAKTAREHPMPYESRFLEYSFFTDFSQQQELIYKTIRPGKKAHDPTVTDLRLLEYRPDGTIWYKLNFDDALRPLPHRPTPVTRVRSLSQLPKLYTSRRSISTKKFKDLQDLKSVIPANCHSFYDDLPHTN